MKAGARLRRAVWSVVVCLAVIGVTVATRRIIKVVPVLTGGYHAPVATSNPRVAQFVALDDIFARYPVLILVHVVPGLFFMILGPLQFSANLRTHHPQWHRWSGRIFVISGAVIGISAVVMSISMPAIGGVNQAVATTLFGMFFLFALSKAFWHIRRREIIPHREWMMRAFAVGLAVAAIRPIIGVFFATSRFTGLTPHEFFGPAFWLGFTLCLLAAEAWIRVTMPQLTAV